MLVPNADTIIKVLYNMHQPVAGHGQAMIQKFLICRGPSTGCLEEFVQVLQFIADSTYTGRLAIEGAFC